MITSNVALVRRFDVTRRCIVRQSWPCLTRRVDCRAASLITLSDEDKYYYREVSDFVLEYNTSAPGDFYELLGVDHEADKASIKKAFREKQRLVHPDIAGPSAEDLSILLNKAYQVLMDPNQRIPYDAELREFHKQHGAFDGRPVSEWMGDDQEQRAIFVDETTCIGCQNCSGCASNTFVIEDLWGRARVSHQWGDEEEWIREAIAMCPVDCIYFVQRKQLALLEHVMKSCKREDAAILARRRSGNMGAAPSKENPFTKAADFMRRRSFANKSQFTQVSEKKQLLQDEDLASAIAHAWLQLPKELRLKGWVSWVDDVTVAVL